METTMTTAQQRYESERRSWMARLATRGRKMAEVSDDELIREAREWVDWRWSDYRQVRSAMASGDPAAMDDCMGIAQIEPPDSPKQNYEAMYERLVRAVAEHREAAR